MSILNNKIPEIPPTHPGEMLREDFMQDYNLSASTLAEYLCVNKNTIDEILQEKKAISPDMALRLSILFGNSPQFWLNAQNAIDLWYVHKSRKQEIDRVYANIASLSLTSRYKKFK